MKHVLYKTEDLDCPSSVLDTNREVCLALCRVCGAGESDLNEFPTCNSYKKVLASSYTKPSKEGSKYIMCYTYNERLYSVHCIIKKRIHYITRIASKELKPLGTLVEGIRPIYILNSEDV